MAKLKLAEGGFTLMRAGKQTLVITKAEGKPASRPITMEVEFENEYGETIKNSYTLDERNEKGFFVTSVFLKACLGSIEEFDTDEIADLEGKYLDVEITHVTLPNKNDETKTVTFANITKIIGSAEPFGGTAETSAPKRPRL